MSTLYIVGMGPGEQGTMTYTAYEVMKRSDVIVGYKAYTELLGPEFAGKDVRPSGMRQEVDRCRECIELAKSGKTVALICSGDAGIYGMASLTLELGAQMDFDNIEIVPGITAASSGAAVLGAPLNHDFCVISLSDLLTPWELIEKRLACAAEGDFAIALYNPSSHKRHDHLQRACDILLRVKSPDTACGYVRNIGREGEESHVMTLAELRNAQVDMFTTCFIGNSHTRILGDRLVTPRGYQL